jgi:hypothetical protein
MHSILYLNSAWQSVRVGAARKAAKIAVSGSHFRVNACVLCKTDTRVRACFLAFRHALP